MTAVVGRALLWTFVLVGVGLVGLGNMPAASACTNAYHPCLRACDGSLLKTSGATPTYSSANLLTCWNEAGTRQDTIYRGVVVEAGVLRDEAGGAVYEFSDPTSPLDAFAAAGHAFDAGEAGSAFFRLWMVEGDKPVEITIAAESHAGSGNATPAAVGPLHFIVSPSDVEDGPQEDYVEFTVAATRNDQQRLRYTITSDDGPEFHGVVTIPVRPQSCYPLSTVAFATGGIAIAAAGIGILVGYLLRGSRSRVRKGPRGDL